MYVLTWSMKFMMMRDQALLMICGIDNEPASIVCDAVNEFHDIGNVI